LKGEGKVRVKSEAISGGEESKARLNWAACESYRLGGISFK